MSKPTHQVGGNSTEITTINEHKTKALMYLNQAGNSLIAFGNELNLIKASLPHGEFGQWIGANIPMQISQCQKYMAIAKSNTHSNGYLNIDSEVLLLAFEPEVREAVREELKDCNQKESTEIIRSLKKSLKEEKQRALNWKQQALEKRQELEESEKRNFNLRQTKNPQPEIVYVDDSKKVSEELKKELTRTKEKLKSAQLEKIEAIKNTRESIANGMDKTIVDLQKRETAQASRVKALQEQINHMESRVIADEAHKTAQDRYKKALIEQAIALMVRDDFPPNADQIVIWEKLLNDTQLMLNTVDIYEAIG